MHRDIFGLGGPQLVICAAVIGARRLCPAACRSLGAAVDAASRWRCRPPRSRCRPSTSAASCSRPMASAPSPCCSSRTSRSCRSWRWCRSSPSRWRRGTSPDAALVKAGTLIGGDRRGGAGRALPAQPALPRARQHRRARGDDRRRPAPRARHGAADAMGRHVDGARRLPGRRAPGRIATTATSWRPISSRSAASCSACSSWASACRSTAGWCSPTG